MRNASSEQRPRTVGRKRRELALVRSRAPQTKRPPIARRALAVLRSLDQDES
jgi:hypothetical protein